MAATSISVTKHRAALARARERSGAPAAAILNTGAMVLLGAALGFAESKGLPDGFIKNAEGVPMVPTKVAIGLVAHGIAAMSSGGVSKAAKLVGDTCAVAYGYAAGKTHELVAG